MGLELRLKAISSRAFGLACEVVRDPSLRSRFSTQVSRLEEEFEVVRRELRLTDPALSERLGGLVSETILDLGFVESELGLMSLRLNQVRLLAETTRR